MLLRGGGGIQRETPRYIYNIFLNFFSGRFFFFLVQVLLQLPTPLDEVALVHFLNMKKIE